MSHARPQASRLIPWAIIAPILFSGLIEIGQQTLTPTRAADWWDFIANSIGCLTAARHTSYGEAMEGKALKNPHSKANTGSQ